ncbi:glycosyltransferase [Halomonas piscis]|uniref:Glycosyltransferase n=1 Tax=Halomonas piscis TaxID=3031727 RepID=A0ABY9YZ85_9GAMM|nr:glycosyltransferase [Halomonas piscis]WNK20147.1 glycosyltransferase [Halomonas piscis]
MSQETSKPLRILHVFASLDRGGAEGMAMSLYRNIDKTKIQFDFVVNNRDKPYAHEEEIKALGGRVFRMPAFKGPNVLRYYKAWDSFLKAHPEWGIIHAHHTTPAFIYLAAARNNGRIAIAHSHIAGYEKNIKSLIKIATRYPLRYIANHLVSCSKTAAQWMFGKKSSQTTVIKML